MSVATVGIDVDSTLVAADRLITRRIDEMGSHHSDSAAGAANPLWVDLAEQWRRRMARPGKQLRPRVAHAAWVAALQGASPGASRRQMVHLCAALELLHLFALVHDDVMDGGTRRRGLSTVHVESAASHRALGGLGDPVRFGDSVAVLFGDLLLAEAYDVACVLPSQVRRRWQQMIIELVHGQLDEVSATAGRVRSSCAVRRIGRLKSGRYTVRRPAELGATLANADPALLDSLGRWGDLVGDAFLLRDDLLGVWGDPGRSGKSATDDLRDAKPTQLLAWAHAELTSESDRAMLAECDAGRLDEAGARALGRALELAGLRQRGEERIASLLAAADRELDGTGLSSSSVEDLSRLARSAGTRTR